MTHVYYFKCTIFVYFDANSCFGLGKSCIRSAILSAQNFSQNHNFVEDLVETDCKTFLWLIIACYFYFVNG